MLLKKGTIYQDDMKKLWSINVERQTLGQKTKTKDII